jgi:hypothetical protein
MQKGSGEGGASGAEQAKRAGRGRRLSVVAARVGAVSQCRHSHLAMAAKIVIENSITIMMILHCVKYCSFEEMGGNIDDDDDDMALCKVLFF